MSSSTIIGISCAILVLVFLVQRFGTAKVAVCFAPVVMFWLILNFAFGIYVGNSDGMAKKEVPSVSLTIRGN